MVEITPEIVVWEYTLRCDSKCIHCGSNASSARKNELTTEEASNLVEQISKIGFKLVVLSGGEPTLREDWVNTAEKIKEKDMEFGIISNALSWNPMTIETLTDLNPYSIGFSVDGERELHDYLRGVAGSHKKIFDSIRNLKRKNATVCAITAVNKMNLEQLTDIRNRLIVNNVDAWQLQMASPIGRMAKNMNLILNEDEHYRLGKFIIETREILPSMNVQAADCIGYFGSLEEKIRDYEWSGCMAGIKSIGIESDGTVKGCLSLMSKEAKEGNIRKEELEEIWLSPIKFKYNRQFTIDDLKGYCKVCEKGIGCKGGCQSQSIAFFNEFHNTPYCFLRYEKSKTKE